MSFIKSPKVQIGTNVTAANNFVLSTNNDGTAKLARGTVDGTTQDILTVDAGGKVTLLDATIPKQDGLPSFACRAWVNFDGTRNAAGGTDTLLTNRFIRASGNVASVLRNAAGDYTITFTTAMPDANYAASGGGSVISGGALQFEATTPRTSAAYRMRTTDVTGANVDTANSSVTFFR